MAYLGAEKRKYPRINCHFLVYYHMLEGSNEIDLSQMKNVSVGGMLLTTSKPFEKGAKLALKIRLPGVYVESAGRIIESYPLQKGIPIYETRLEFSDMGESDRQILEETLNNYLKAIK